MFIERLRHYVSSAVKSSKTNHASPLLQYIDRGFLLPSQRLIRLGTAYGGWLIPADAGITSSSICYSAGAGEDISFDCALAERFHCQKEKPLAHNRLYGILLPPRLRDFAHSGERLSNGHLSRAAPPPRVDSVRLLPNRPRCPCQSSRRPPKISRKFPRRDLLSSYSTSR